ncbi:MAG TPA: polysaccharide biosynthesis tyrosine autokinase [Gaiellaceae bacterium]|nr:polysaccharide biosynthesis tyrosine autokinase [Gaiellaceae bacterium]
MAEPGGSTTLIDLLGVIRRHKWIVIQAAILVPVVAVVHAVRQPTVYASSAQVLLSRENAAATFAGVNDPTASEDPNRYAATQAFLARSPDLLAQVVKDVHIPGLTKGELGADSTVTPRTGTDILTFYVRNRVAADTQALANEYAHDYTVFRRTQDTSAIRKAVAELNLQIGQLAQNELSTGAGQSLLERRQQLQTLEALESQNTYLARPASPPSVVSPTPRRDATLGLALGILLGIGLAFLREAFDTRIRSSEVIAERLRIPLLARLGPPPRELRDSDGLLMLERPYSPEGEAFRMLRTSLDLINLNGRNKTIMVTSAVEGEGKTTTACNLAVALAAAGRSVGVIDLDLRRPSVSRYFGINGRPGVTEVALGAATLDDALVRIEPEEWQEEARDLVVLPSGFLPPNPSEFASSAVVGDIMQRIAERVDLLIVDTPPVLQAAEAIALSDRVDAILIVVKLASATRHKLGELRHALDAAPATLLGFVLTDTAASSDGYGSAYAYPDRDLVA